MRATTSDLHFVKSGSWLVFVFVSGPVLALLLLLVVVVDGGIERSFVIVSYDKVSQSVR